MFIPDIYLYVDGRASEAYLWVCHKDSAASRLIGIHRIGDVQPVGHNQVDIAIKAPKIHEAQFMLRFAGRNIRIVGVIQP